MPAADYSSYHQAQGTTSDGNKFDNFIDAVQSTVNGIDNANIAGAAGIVASKIAVSGLPGFELAYVEFTSTVTANNVAEASATLVVSAGAITFDGSAVVIEFGCAGVVPGGTATGGINLWDVTTDQGRLFDGRLVTMAVSDYPCLLRRRVVPSAGLHTYNIRVWNTTASNLNVTAGAGGAGGAPMPGYIRITKV